MFSMLVGCEGGSTFNVQNPSPPPQTTVQIAFQSSPPLSMPINGTTTLVATVTNDPTNAGVGWSLNCATPGACGSLSALHTASGGAVTYTPPDTFNGNILPVTIVAYATASQSANQTAAITVTAFGSVLKGTFVLQAKGSDSTFSSPYPYQLTGAVYLDGNGNVVNQPGGTSAGQQIVNSVDLNGAADSTPAQITGGTYFIGGDGRGFLTLNATDPAGDMIVEDFSLVVTSGSEALIAQEGGTITPPAGSPTTLQQSGSGTLELQDPVAAASVPTSGYAFVANGTDAGYTPIAYGGVVNIGATGTFSGVSNDVDVLYANNTFFSTQCSFAQGVNGSVTGPGPFGTVTLNLDAPNCFQSNTLQLTGYIVDSSHIRVIETDGAFLTAGLAVGQGAATGTFTDASLSGPYVFDVLGMDLTSLYPSSLTSADMIVADGAGNIPSAVMDTFLIDSSAGSPAQISDQFTASYHVDGAMIGRARLSAYHFATHRNPAFNPNITLYLTGTQPAALVLFGASVGSGTFGYPSLGIGSAYTQQANASFLSTPETYGVSFTLQNNGTEDDGTGQMIATPNATPPGGTLTGTVDQFSSIGSPQNLSDTYNCPQGSPCPDAFGRYTDSTFLGFQASYYLISPNQGFVIETDLINPGTGQVGLSFFTQACSFSACPASGSQVSRKHARAKSSSTNR
jgi:hypothetical protein